MGLFNRMSTVIKAKMNKFADMIVDPRETLDYSYEIQLEILDLAA
ncbi:MAG: PspA/IM30 family protein, partial [Clostridiales bacterium]|nr:PspA/IM30 family protein [Clostridiales bacterium]